MSSMMVMTTTVMVRMVMAKMVLVKLLVKLLVKPTDSRPCSVPYGRGSVFNSTVRPELEKNKA